MRLFLFILFFISIVCKGQQLILPGAHPDPSVTKVGDTYWASATSSNWFPAFPLLYSKDLVTWQQQGFIFTKKPAWAHYYFWAPELTYDSGRVYVYYTAHQKNGTLCVAVASADKPEGPYTDHGPLVCQQYGSIDAFPIRDTSGKLYLVWKEDANSVNKPTPIWAQEMNEERTLLLGEKVELFRNDVPWEKELVEGVAIIRHKEHYYAFYAAAGCCGSRCTYVTGVARSQNVLGPWEKDPRNPVLIDDENWLCKGHGTPVEKDGRFYFLYHAYDRVTSAFTGREGMLQEFTFNNDGWIDFVVTKQDSIVRQEVVRDEFNEPLLAETWQWNVFQEVKFEVDDGKLKLQALPDKTGSFLAKKISSADYVATTTVMTTSSTSMAGIAAIGDEKNMVALVLKDYQLQILKVENGKDTLFPVFRIPVREKIYLQMSVEVPYRITFLYSIDGKKFIPINYTPLRGAFLPPWDSPPRAGLMSKGTTDQVAVFDRFELRAGALKSSEIAEEVFRLNAFEITILVVFSLVMLFLVFRYLRQRASNRKAST